MGEGSVHQIKYYIIKIIMNFGIDTIRSKTYVAQQSMTRFSAMIRTVAAKHEFCSTNPP
jgi:hypothetical protein